MKARSKLHIYHESCKRLWSRLPLWGKGRDAGEADPWQRLIVYDLGEVVWTAELPSSELRANLPESCAWDPEPGLQRLWGAALGCCAGTLLAAMVLLPLGAVPALVMACFLGGPLGGVAGFALAPRYRARRFWTVRRVEAPSIRLRPISHTHLTGIESPEELASSERGKAGGMHLARSWYHNLEARPFRRFFTSKLTGWQKLQIGSLVVLAVSMAGLLVLLIAATAD